MVSLSALLITNYYIRMREQNSSFRLWSFIIRSGELLQTTRPWVTLKRTSTRSTLAKFELYGRSWMILSVRMIRHCEHLSLRSHLFTLSQTRGYLILNEQHVLDLWSLGLAKYCHPASVSSPSVPTRVLRAAQSEKNRIFTSIYWFF